jgi:membrane protease YdiL (CAAX protease family)
LRGLGEPVSTAAAWKVIGVQAVLCFLIHLGKPNAELIASLPASVLFGWIAWRSRSIWYGLVIHFAVGIVNDLGAM